MRVKMPKITLIMFHSGWEQGRIPPPFTPISSLHSASLYCVHFTNGQLPVIVDCQLSVKIETTSSNFVTASVIDYSKS